jgi:hypothetical protein
VEVNRKFPKPEAQCRDIASVERRVRDGITDVWERQTPVNKRYVDDHNGIQEGRKKHISVSMPSQPDHSLLTQHIARPSHTLLKLSLDRLDVEITDRFPFIIEHPDVRASPEVTYGSWSNSLS